MFHGRRPWSAGSGRAPNRHRHQCWGQWCMMSDCRAQEDCDVPLQEGVAAAQRDLALPAQMRHAHHRRLVPGVGRLQAQGASPVSCPPMISPSLTAAVVPASSYQRPDLLLMHADSSPGAATRAQYQGCMVMHCVCVQMAGPGGVCLCCSIRQLGCGETQGAKQ